jgi:hypothetical protein
MGSGVGRVLPYLNAGSQDQAARKLLARHVALSLVPSRDVNAVRIRGPQPAGYGQDDRPGRFEAHMKIVAGLVSEEIGLTPHVKGGVESQAL